MSFDWKAQLGNPSGQTSPVFEAGVIAHFGKLATELAAAKDGTVVAPLGHLGLIECAGKDAGAFLHNQLTSDITHLVDGQAQHSAWCTAKGRMLASFLILRSGDTYLLQLADELLAPVLKRFQMYVLRTDVKLADVSPTHALIGLAGPRAAAALAAAGLPLPATTLSVAAATAGLVVRVDEQRFEVVVDQLHCAEVWQKLSGVATPVGVSAWQWLDVQAGLPMITAATREEFVPQMANFDQLGGVSFHKGCYPGQEVIARTQYLGKVKRHLYRVATGEAMAPGQPIFSAESPDQVCGQIVNASPAPGGGHIALAVLQENAATGEIRLGSADGPPLTGATPVVATSTVAD